MPLSLDQVAVVLAYVVPGYVFLSVVGWFLPPRAQPLSQVALLSIALSVPLTWAARETVGRLQLPADSLALTSIAFTYAAAAAALVGALRRIRFMRRIAYRLTGVSHPKIWVQLLDEHQGYLQVQVDTMHVFYGYAASSSNDPSASLPDLLLKRAAVVDAAGERTALTGTDGLYIPGGRIRWIQLLEDSKPQHQQGTEDVRRRNASGPRYLVQSGTRALKRLRKR